MLNCQHLKQLGGIGGDTPVDPAVTLTSISATYTGGDVTTGTAVTDLTGITVTATYSDGSTATVTGYTLSGDIVEGENTITVSYGGLTTTFTVSGKEQDPLYTLESCNDVVVLDRYNHEDRPALLTVNGNDIMFRGADGVNNNIWYFHVNCSSAITNGVNGRTAPVWFTIPSGAFVELKLSRTSHIEWRDSHRIGLNKNGNTEYFNFAIGGQFVTPPSGGVPTEQIFTATMTEDTEITALVADITNAHENELQSVNVKLYVNGVRWI